MRIFSLRIFSTFFVLLLCLKSFSQIVISGSTCVVPGTIYQYVVSGNDSTSSVQVCIAGGKFADSSNGNTCTSFTRSLRKLIVVWDDSNADHGSLSLNSTVGNASIAVRFTSKLVAGSIDSTAKVQLINWKTVPAPIRCSMDSGGSCSASYNHQWQWSPDVVNWIDIPAATGENLTIDSALTQSKFYRRKVTELNSGSVAYSDPASVLVITPPDSTSQTNALMSPRNNSSKQDTDAFAELILSSRQNAVCRRELKPRSFEKSTSTTFEK